MLMYLRSITDILHLLPLALSLSYIYNEEEFFRPCHLFRTTPSTKAILFFRATGPSRLASFQVS